MPRPRLAAGLRRLVIERAQGHCEYCLLPAAWAALPHHIDHIDHIDHIRPLKHQGNSTAENLAYACFACNLAKGSDIAGFDPLDGRLTRLFHPRIDEWTQHFAIDTRSDAGRIVGLNASGRATAVLLRFNDAPRVRQRQQLISAQVFPNWRSQNG